MKKHSPAFATGIAALALAATTHLEAQRYPVKPVRLMQMRARVRKSLYANTQQNRILVQNRLL